ncbi:hypothetical protein LOTGIDRAFT_231545 [Lottia gigantea]|uniref:TLDc domain-containing protein n=1 Tax=Lottia gigantea TaxID=225164 RepID=V4A0P0_LOTGI|nr:hypothetical protein LOTGIDRAFT_231545 [Lottia gigantea]ESO97348.1 hypothetical protein LOTGIDRAFT_231545 [Lottia gigantea]
MGNSQAPSTPDEDGPSSSNSAGGIGGIQNRSSRRASNKAYCASLSKLFEKLELTADGGNTHPGELSRNTFEDVFHGPLHKFGSLMYSMMVNGHSNKERITREQLLNLGKKLLRNLMKKNNMNIILDCLLMEINCLINKMLQEPQTFDRKSNRVRRDALEMVEISYALTLSASKIPYCKDERDDKIFESVVTSMFGVESEIGFDAFESWLKWNCPHFFCGVHNWVFSILTGSQLPSELEVAPVPQLEGFAEGRYLVTMGMLWILSATIPTCFTKSPTGETPSNNPLLNSYHLLMKLARLSRCQSWTLLYSSSQHGMSLNRFMHHVISYSAPTMTVLSFEGRNLYCVAADCGWRESSSLFGGENCMLIQISPVYRVIQAGEKMLMWNEFSRDLPKGIQIGKGNQNKVLFLPQEFDEIHHYGVPCALHKIEVWGCGGATVREAQVKQKQWEAKDTQRQQSRKLRLDLDSNWEENADKKLLEWGGIKTNHSQR